VRMGLDRPAFAVLTVGGTNGKGSTVAMLDAILRAAGYRTGAYTSPHLIDYNERVCIGGASVDDSALCAAFERIEAARGPVSLTYFEFGTLAAMELFHRAGLDVAVLEVGMGGRLDAVNVWDADAAVVASVGIDHVQWLGPDREAIGREKAGIFRPGRPAIVGDPDPPASLVAHAERIGARLLRVGREFAIERGPDGWAFRAGARLRAGLPYPALRGDFQLHNAACALMALDGVAARLPVDQGQVRAGLLGAQLAGRFQTLPGRPLKVLDVAHNVQAAAALAATLRRQPIAGRTVAVLGMLQDKPIAEVAAQLAPLVDSWHVATLDVARGARSVELAAALVAAGVTAPIREFPDPPSAFRAAEALCGADDRILAFGSFYTVGGILAALAASNGGP
jgi:dihydrofolate synthase / folylpolyglutamate synthase